MTTSSATTFIVLLRAIGPETHRRMSMAALTQACMANGLRDVQSFGQTGNLIVRTRRNKATVRAIVERSVRKFELENAVFVRTADSLSSLVDQNPFPNAAVQRPGQMVVCFLDSPPDPSGLAELARRAGAEKLAAVNGELCIDYADRIAGSKIAPGVVERVLGTTGTARNWNTITRLIDLARKPVEG